MFKVTKLADYSVVLLSAMSDELQSSSKLAEFTKLPEPTVSKILKLLAKAEIVSSIRGAKGGYTLARPLSDITIADVVAAIDGPIAITACAESLEDDCDFAAFCSHKGLWDPVNIAIRGTLEEMSLHDMLRAKNEKSLKREVA